MDAWLNSLRINIEKFSPDLVSLFDLYANESKFGRIFIDEDLKNLPPGASILEVGAGSMILSCQLVLEGYKVKALEPFGEGFSHFNQLREIVMREASRLGCAPDILCFPIEKLDIHEYFDFAFSVNVMEHVSNIEASILNVSTSLRPGSVYHFTCPNYLFPYEPHFNIPILFNKKITGFIFHKLIKNNINIPDPFGVWRSLNWISSFRLLKFSNKNNSFSLSLKSKVFMNSLIRVTNDEQFAARRPYWLKVIIGWLIVARLYKLLIFIPICLQPIIDCEIKVKT